MDVKMLLTAEVVVLGHAASAVVFGWLYFGRFALARPPIGIFGLADVGFLLGGIVVVPLLYLVLPLWLVAGLLALGALSAVHLAGEPVLSGRRALWAGVLGLGAAEVGAFFVAGPPSAPLFLVNNVLIVLVSVAVANLWAQSGMKARDAAVLGAALTVYDFVATARLPLMGDLFARVAELPFAPLVAWPAGPDGQWLGLGLGDLLLATVFPLVLRKAYGTPAGLAAVGLGLVALVGVVALAHLAAVSVFPVMVVLGPLMVLQYAFWTRLRGPERTTWQYLQAEPHPYAPDGYAVRAGGLGAPSFIASARSQ
jgi:hypothetical protein